MVGDGGQEGLGRVGPPHVQRGVVLRADPGDRAAAAAPVTAVVMVVLMSMLVVMSMLLLVVEMVAAGIG